MSAVFYFLLRFNFVRTLSCQNRNNFELFKSVKN